MPQPRHVTKSARLHCTGEDTGIPHPVLAAMRP